MSDRIKISDNFYLDEVVDLYTYVIEPDRGLSMIDKNVVKCLQLLRTLKGSSLSVNNWWSYYVENKESKTLNEMVKHINKTRSLHQWSGYRSNVCGIGSKYSAHKKGKAVDPKGEQHALYKIVKDNVKDFYLAGLRRLEDPKITNGWLHMDTMEWNTTPGHINVVDLKTVVEKIKVFDEN